MIGMVLVTHGQLAREFVAALEHVSSKALCTSGRVNVTQATPSSSICSRNRGLNMVVTS